MKIENIKITGFQAALRGMRNPKDSWSRSDTISIYEYLKKEPDNLIYNKLSNGNTGIQLFKNFQVENRNNIFSDNINEKVNNYKFYFNNKSNLYLEDNDITTYVDMDYIPIIGPNDMKLCKTLISGGTVHSKFARYITVTMDITASLDYWKEESTYKVGTIQNSCSTMHTITKHPLTINNFSTADLRDVDISYMKKNIIPYLNGIIDDDKLSTVEKTRILSKMNLLGFEQKRTVQYNYEVLHNMYVWRRNHKLYEWRYLMNEIVTKLPYFNDFYIETDAKKGKYVSDLVKMALESGEKGTYSPIAEKVLKYVKDNNILIQD